MIFHGLRPGGGVDGSNRCTVVKYEMDLTGQAGQLQKLRKSPFRMATSFIENLGFSGRHQERNTHLIPSNVGQTSGFRKMNSPFKSLLSLSIVSISLMLHGCSSPAYRAHPEFEVRARKFNTLALMPSDVRAYEVSGLGLMEHRDDWCAASKENIVNALKEGLKEKHFEIKVVTVNEEEKEEVEEIQALYRAVNKSIQLHTYGPQLFPEKEKNFKYSLGSVEKILQRSGSDSLVFVSGFDHVSKGMGAAFVSVAVVDSSGSVIWYCAKGIRGERGLRDPVSASALVQNILASFPEVGG